MALTKVTSKGQVTIPVEVRKALNIEEGDALLFETAGQRIATMEVVKSKKLDKFRGSFARDGVVSSKAHVRQNAKRSLGERSLKE